MLKIEKYVLPDAEQWNVVIEGMRNPMNSWDKSDTEYALFSCTLGENDYKLMKSLAKAGTEHSKYRRMLPVWVDITAPLYWWKEADTYTVGKVQNSCSTMHKIHAKEFTLDDFSHEHLRSRTLLRLMEDVAELNFWRDIYLNGGMVDNGDGTAEVFNSKDKDAWWQMIQLLPSPYNQKRTVFLNYEVLAKMYRERKNHKLDEWHTFCDWIKTLPYSELITMEE
jgi:hypothetical protein